MRPERQSGSMWVVVPVDNDQSGCIWMLRFVSHAKLRIWAFGYSPAGLRARLVHGQSNTQAPACGWNLQVTTRYVLPILTLYSSSCEQKTSENLARRSRSLVSRS